MATYEELREAINDYVEQAHKSARVTRSLRHWNCVMYIQAVDLEQGFTLTVRDSRATVQDGSCEKPDLIVRGPSEDLANIFWCDVNPTSTYMQGVIKTQGSPENVMRLDAMSMLIFLELHKE
ncbi:MAG TPA: SCP2 sterol-binding domain-containing protein [Ktedonosporobacter sp.]|nr:SCP2 sterol-binding domain-containing protein [Ktedonosporobacter sp.]